MTSTGARPAEGASPGRRDVATVVVGAGQAGLATAHQLRRRHQECLALDTERRVGDQ